MYRRSFPAPLKLMKHISEVNGKTNEKRSGITVLNEEEVRRNNRCLEFFVVMVRSGPRLLMTLELKPFNLLSQEKFQQGLSSVPIPGGHTPVSLHGDMFIVLSIMVKNSTATEKEVISMVWRDSGDS